MPAKYVHVPRYDLLERWLGRGAGELSDDKVQVGPCCILLIWFKEREYTRASARGFATVRASPGATDMAARAGPSLFGERHSRFCGLPMGFWLQRAVISAGLTTSGYAQPARVWFVGLRIDQTSVWRKPPCTL